MDWIGVFFFASYGAFAVLGFVIHRKRRTFVPSLAILLGLPFGFMLDIDPVYGRDGPSCGWIGQPLTFMLFGLVGILARNGWDLIRSFLHKTRSSDGLQ